jgi:8-oxo-dGTP diphosphatase
VSDRPVLVVAAVLLTPDHQLLMGLRADVLEWEVPGGKVEDETLAEAFARELREEAGVWTDEAPALMGVAEPDPTKNDGVRYVVHFLCVRHWHGFPQRMEPHKCMMWRWFPLTGLPPMKKMTPGTRQFVKNILPKFLQEEAAP